MTNPTMYQINIGGTKLGDQILEGKQSALLDTGNTLIAMGTELQPKVMAEIEKSTGGSCTIQVEQNPMFSQVSCDLDDVSKIPGFSVMQDGEEVYIPGKYLTQACDSSTTSTFALTCLMNFEFSDSGYGLILGKAFLMNSYTTFFLNREEIWMASLYEKGAHASKYPDTHLVWSSEKFERLNEIGMRIASNIQHE